VNLGGHQFVGKTKKKHGQYRDVNQKMTHKGSGKRAGLRLSVGTFSDSPECAKKKNSWTGGRGVARMMYNTSQMKKMKEELTRGIK